MSLTRWSFPQRIAFRFAVIYLGLYELPLLVKRFLPAAWRNAAESIGALEPVVRGFGRVLGIHAGLSMVHPAGSDSPFEWVRILFLVLVALVSTAVWSVLERQREAHPLLFDAFRTALRYALAFTMLNYAIVKPLQFSPLTLTRLLEPYGDASPMGLLWTFMGFSRPYTFATGIVEATGAVLLFWRRTTLLGALILVGATANVFVLDLCYDVPVKQYSAHLLAMALLLCATDGGHLARSLLGLPARTSPGPTDAPRPWPAIRARGWVKGGVIAWTTLMTAYVLWSGYRPLPPRPALYGEWRVASAEPLSASPRGWHHVAVDEWGWARVERMDDSRAWYELDVDARTVTFRPHDATTNEAKATLSYTRPADGELVLEGTVDGEAVTMHLERREKPFLLLSRGFHWVQEGYVNQ